MKASKLFYKSYILFTVIMALLQLQEMKEKLQNHIHNTTMLYKFDGNQKSIKFTNVPEHKFHDE